MLNHGAPVKALAAEVAAEGAHGEGARAVGGEADHGVAEGVGIAGGGEVAGLAFEADFGSAVAIVRDDGEAGEKGLRQSAGEAFAIAGMDEGIGGGEELGDLLRGDEAGHGDAIGQAFFAKGLFEAGAEDAIADPEEVGVGDVGEEVVELGEEVVVAFERLEAGDGGEDEGGGGDVKLGADLFAGEGGVEEGFDVHAAVDGGVEVGGADAGGEGLAGHGIGDADGGIAMAGGGGFESDPHFVDDGTLVGVEWEAVDGVDDGGGGGMRSAEF